MSSDWGGPWRYFFSLSLNVRSTCWWWWMGEKVNYLFINLPNGPFLHLFSIIVCNCSTRLRDNFKTAAVLCRSAISVRWKRKRKKWMAENKKYLNETWEKRLYRKMFLCSTLPILTCLQYWNAATSHILTCSFLSGVWKSERIHAINSYPIYTLRIKHIEPLQLKTTRASMLVRLRWRQSFSGEWAKMRTLIMGQLLFASSLVALLAGKL